MLPLEILAIETTASNRRSLRLTQEVAWEQFADYAQELTELLGGQITARAESPVERVWELEVQAKQFWLSFDDFGLGVSLDPRDDAAEDLLATVQHQLMAARTSKTTASLPERAEQGEDI